MVTALVPELCECIKLHSGLVHHRHTAMGSQLMTELARVLTLRRYFRLHATGLSCGAMLHPVGMVNREMVVIHSCHK